MFVQFNSHQMHLNPCAFQVSVNMNTVAETNYKIRKGANGEQDLTSKYILRRHQVGFAGGRAE